MPAPASPLVGLKDFTAARFYTSSAGDLPGAAAGFSAAALFAALGADANNAAQTLFGNKPNSANQGWRIRHDIGGISVQVGTAVGGEISADAIANLDNGKLMLAHLVYQPAVVDQELALYVNGNLAAVTSTAANAYGPSALAPIIGADRSGAANAVANPSTGNLVLGCAYVESVLTPAQVRQHWLQCYNAGRMVDAALENSGYAGGPTFTQLWDAWFNNAARDSAGLGASSWVSRKTPAITMLKQGGADNPLVQGLHS